MKTKLLRKIRRENEIRYYPNGIKLVDEHSTMIIGKGRYGLFGKITKGQSRHTNDYLFHDNKQGCLDFLKKLVREKYYKYSVRSKGKKVWPLC